MLSFVLHPIDGLSYCFLFACMGRGILLLGSDLGIVAHTLLISPSATLPPPLLQIRYRKDKMLRQKPCFPVVSEVKDLTNGCAIAAVIHHYCPGLLRLEGKRLLSPPSQPASQTPAPNPQCLPTLCPGSLYPPLSAYPSPPHHG